MSAAVLDLHPSGASVIYRADHPAPGRVQRPLATFADLAYVLGQLEPLGVHQLWLTPRWLREHRIPDWPRDERQVLRGWCPIGMSSAIVSPSMQRFAFDRPPDGASLARALAVVSRGLGVQLGGSMGATVGQLLGAALARRDEPPLDFAQLPDVAEPTLFWIRPLDVDEREQPWLLAVDRRGAYLHAMELAELGVGQPEHLALDPELLHSGRAGYYHLQLRAWPHVYLPDPYPRRQTDAWHWLTEPSVRLALAQKLIVGADDAWLWPHKSKVLKPIAERVRRAQRLASDEHVEAVALPILKRAYTAFVGRLRIESARGTPSYRPDWHAHIVADARERFWRTGAAFEHLPAAADVDCWYVPSSSTELPPDVNPAWYRVKAAVPMAKVRECFEQRAPTALLQRVERFK
jgi:hypothetical protein